MLVYEDEKCLDIFYDGDVKSCLWLKYPVGISKIYTFSQLGWELSLEGRMSHRVCNTRAMKEKTKLENEIQAMKSKKLCIVILLNFHFFASYILKNASQIAKRDTLIRTLDVSNIETSRKKFKNEQDRFSCLYVFD